MSKFKPVFIDPHHLTPVSEKEPEICMRCLKKTARWRVGKDPEVHTECSYCIMYSTPWGKDNAVGIMQLVAAVEHEMKTKISDENGFVLESQADRIMVAIRQTSAAKLVFQRLRKRDDRNRP